ncbi:hypothetical protein [Azoarcus sp. L1K30]|uniref:hypothetical protein n=1 Tax=Azoarcus sp. L1K30 TaxID=2820277 RepID=UPI0020126A71|nr:hypothetical protein [Azoarcus sp. L1K30]
MLLDQQGVILPLATRRLSSAIDLFGVMQDSSGWRRVFDRIHNGGIPVVAAMRPR